MKKRLKSYILKEKLYSEDANLLVAVSGGIDSVVLCHLLQSLGQRFGMAHCNFQLRGEDSDEDAIFVENLARQFDVPFHKTTFNTKELLKNSTESTQGLARQLRYDWFAQLKTDFGYDCIATGHHQNDQVETILYKLAKGTGVRGARGMLPIQGDLVRPLLGFRKDELENYAYRHRIAFRKDISNDTDDYQRNFIRHQIVPQFEKINPRFVEKLTDMSIRFRDLEALLQQEVDLCRTESVAHENGITIIDFPFILEQKAASSILFELLSAYGFGSEQVRQIEQTFPANGRQFLSETYQLLIHQRQLLIRKKVNSDKQTYLLPSEVSSFNFTDKNLTISYLDAPISSFEADASIAYLDADKLVFPLTIRTWQAGDFFHPFGMKGKRQKVQDYYSNLKLSLFDKEATFILESETAICWIMGKRMDERFRVTEETKKVVKIVFT